MEENRNNPVSSEAFIQVRDLKRYFPIRKGVFSH